MVLKNLISETVFFPLFFLFKFNENEVDASSETQNVSQSWNGIRTENQKVESVSLSFTLLSNER